MSWPRRIALGLGAVGVALAALLLGVGWWLSAPGYAGPVSDHFDGRIFHNRAGVELPGGRRAMALIAEPRGPWEQRAFAAEPLPPERVHDGLRVTFVNHATVLIQVAGLNLLTDPIWSERCSAVQWIGPRRFHPPPFPLEQLPPIDAVLISHNHYDHLDLPTLRWLAEHRAPTVYAGLGNGALLRAQGLEAVDLDWGQRVEHGVVGIEGAETQHFSSRGLFDRMRTLWLGFVLHTPEGAIYFGGDTGYGPHFAATGAEHGPFRLALLPIGAYGPRWFMAPVHQDPAEAVAAHLDLRAQTSVGIHFGTFRLTTEGQDDPVRGLEAARAEAGLPEGAFRALTPGQGFAVPQGPPG